MRTHRSPHPTMVKLRETNQRIPWWPMYGLILLVLAGFTYFQIDTLKSEGEARDRTISALAVALTAEQNDKLASGEVPVAPAAREIVDDPKVIPGEPGADGRDGEDGRDGIDATLPPLDELRGEKGPKGDKGDKGDTGSTPSLPPSSDLKGEPGVDGKNGQNGQDGQDGRDGKDGLNGADGEPPGSWTWRMGKLEYTCTRVENFNPTDPQYTCSGVPVIEE